MVPWLRVHERKMYYPDPYILYEMTVCLNIPVSRVLPQMP